MYLQPYLKEHYTQATSGIMGIIIYNPYHVLSSYKSTSGIRIIVKWLQITVKIVIILLYLIAR